MSRLLDLSDRGFRYNSLLSLVCLYVCLPASLSPNLVLSFS